MQDSYKPDACIGIMNFVRTCRFFFKTRDKPATLTLKLNAINFTSILNINDVGGGGEVFLRFEINFKKYSMI